MENLIPLHFPVPFPIIRPAFIQVPPVPHCSPNPDEDVTFRQQGDKFGKTVKLIGWCPPPDGWVKINTDGAYKGSLDLGSPGGLVRDSNGNWCAGFAMNLGRAVSPLEAEFIGILGGLELVWKMVFRNVILESDCKAAVDFLINGSESHDHLVRCIRQLIGREWNLRIQHKYREGNQAADWLANLGIQLSFGYHEFADPPLGILNHIIEDCYGFKYPRLCNR